MTHPAHLNPPNGPEHHGRARTMGGRHRASGLRKQPWTGLDPLQKTQVTAVTPGLAVSAGNSRRGSRTQS